MPNHSHTPADRAPRRPMIAIAPDVYEPKPGSVRAQCALTYARAVHAAGGDPVILVPLPELVPGYLERFDGFVLTGGDDPRTEPFGAPTDRRATPVHAARQEFDMALIGGLLERGDIPTLGICLGMQMMALLAGGALNQHLPDTLASHERHRHDAVHPILPVPGQGTFAPGAVTSHHRQAVADAGRLTVVAISDDGVIEAIRDPGARWVIGVQWHPERTTEDALGIGLFSGLVGAARERSFRT